MKLSQEASTSSTRGEGLRRTLRFNAPSVYRADSRFNAPLVILADARFIAPSVTQATNTC